MKTNITDFSSHAKIILSELDQEHRDDARIGSLFINAFLGIDSQEFEPVRDLARSYAYLVCEQFDRDRSAEWKELADKLDNIRWMLEDICNCTYNSETWRRFVLLQASVENLRNDLNGMCIDKFNGNGYRELIHILSGHVRRMDELLPITAFSGNSCSIHKCRCGNGYFYAHQLCRHEIIIDGDGHFEQNIEIYDSEKPYGTFTCTSCGASYEELSEIPEAASEKNMDKDTACPHPDITKADIGNYVKSPHYVSLCSFRGNGSTLVNNEDVEEVVSILKKLGYEDVILTPQSAAPGTTLISRGPRTKDLG